MNIVKRNRNWIFSGIGTAILVAIITILFSTEKNYNKSTIKDVKDNKNSPISNQVGTQNNYYSDSIPNKNIEKKQIKANKIENSNSPHSNNIQGNNNNAINNQQ